MAVGKRIYGNLIISITSIRSFMLPRARKRMDSRKFILERKVLKRPEREKVRFGQENRSVIKLNRQTYSFSSSHKLIYIPNSLFHTLSTCRI